MHVWQWLITGIFAGILARLVLRKSTIGLGGDLTLGALGGLAAGAMLRYGGITTAGGSVAHVAVSLAGAVSVIVFMHAVARIAMRAHDLVRLPQNRRSLESVLSQADSVERNVVVKFLEREPVSRDPQLDAATKETLGQRVADRVATFGGSWAFIGLFIAVLLAWMLYNTEQSKPFDPYPFILLNLVLSCLAAIQAPVILMSQNRQAVKDRERAQEDYAVNLKAEVEILALHTKIDEIKERAWLELLSHQERQLALLEKLEKLERAAKKSNNSV